jgi:ubiquinone/menaquinone biosynthesis C-methylase UbiE
MSSYQQPDKAKEFADFLDTEEGEVQKDLHWQAIKKLLDLSTPANILDAACGTGWLAGKIKESAPTDKISVFGCDSSIPLIQNAKERFVDIHFDLADLQDTLPYTEKFFDSIILNMAIHDLNQPEKALANLNRVLKNDGQLIITLANPYYSYPVGIWKRGILDFLLGRKPVLRLKDYWSFKKADRSFTWHSGNSSYFYTLPETINWLVAARFKLDSMEEITNPVDSQKFGRRYKMHRYPLNLLLSLSKKV